MSLGDSSLGAFSRLSLECHARIRFLAIVSLVFCHATSVSAQSGEAARWLEKETMAYIEFQEVGDLPQRLLEHPLRARLEQLEAYQQALESREFRQFRIGLALVETAMTLDWPEIVKGAAGHGIVVTLDRENLGVLIGLHGDGTEVQRRALGRIVELARGDAQRNGRPDPVGEEKYRERTMLRLGEVSVVRIDDWLWLSNQGASLRKMIDAVADGRTSSLADREGFREAMQESQGAVAWGFFDLEAIRAFVPGGGPPERIENVLVEALFGGLIDRLRHASTATARLEWKDERLTLRATTEFDPQAIEETREYWWGIEGTGAAPPPLEIRNSLLQIAFHRDLSEMWLRGADLFTERTVEQMEQAEGTLTTLFLGADFGADILGAFMPQARLVVARREFPAEGFLPIQKLPTFALVFDLEEVEQMRPQLRRTFQSLIGFINITGAMNGQPQLELQMERSEEFEIQSAHYLTPQDHDPSVGLPIQFNFTPAIGFSGTRCVISSDESLAREALEASDVSVESRDSETLFNTIASTHGKILAEVLRDNREPLIAQAMIDEGKQRDEAERDLDLLAEIVTWFSRLEVRLGHDTQRAFAEVELQTLVPTGDEPQ